MSYDEPLVGSLAFILAIAATAIAVGPWDAPYQLRTFDAATKRFGKPFARGVWAAIAIAAFSAGLAIVSGTRPPYVTPSQQSVLDR